MIVYRCMSNWLRIFVNYANLVQPALAKPHSQTISISTLVLGSWREETRNTFRLLVAGFDFRFGLGR